MLKLRKLTEEDDDNLYIMVKHLANYFDSDISYEQFQDRLKLMRNNSYSAVGAFEGDKIVAASGIWINSRFWCGKYLEIDNFVVDQSYRSSGVGKIMMDYMIKIAREEGANLIFLNVYNTNESAIKFYKKHGFEHIGNFFRLEL